MIIPIDHMQIPVTIMDKYRNVTLSVDVIYVNGMAFFTSMSHHIKFTTVEHLARQDDGSILEAITRIRKVYGCRDFIITELRGDGRFKSLENEDALKGVVVNTCAREEHDPDIERNNRTLKERIRSAYHMLPFNKCIPKRIIIELVCCCVFWLNCFQPSGGISSTASPRTIVTGQMIDYEKHCQLEFGSYVQTHEEHDNGMGERTTGAIALRPSGNAQGGHYFYSLTTGARLHRFVWTPLPMPNDVIAHILRLGQMDDTVRGLVFGDKDGNQNGDAFVDFDESQDDDYDPLDDSSPDGDVVLNSEFTPIDASEMAEITGVNDDEIVADKTGDKDNDNNIRTSEEREDIPGRADDTLVESEIEDAEITGVGGFPDGRHDGENARSVGGNSDNDDGYVDAELTKHVAEEFESRYNLRQRKKTDYNNIDYSHKLPRSTVQQETAMVTIAESQEWALLCFEHAFVTEQVNMKKGIKMFGEKGMDAVMKEMKQLHDRNVMFPKDARRMSAQEPLCSMHSLPPIQ